MRSGEFFSQVNPLWVPYLIKDLNNVGKEAHRLGLELPLIDSARARFDHYVAAGNGRKETASIYQSYLKPL